MKECIGIGKTIQILEPANVKKAGDKPFNLNLLLVHLKCNINAT